MVQVVVVRSPVILVAQSPSLNSEHLQVWLTSSAIKPLSSLVSSRYSVVVDVVVVLG